MGPRTLSGRSPKRLSLSFDILDEEENGRRWTEGEGEDKGEAAGGEERLEERSLKYCEKDREDGRDRESRDEKGRGTTWTWFWTRICA